MALRITRKLQRPKGKNAFSVNIPPKWWNRAPDVPGQGGAFTYGCHANESLQSVITAEILCLDGMCTVHWGASVQRLSEQDCYENPQKLNTNAISDFSSSAGGDSFIMVSSVGGSSVEVQAYTGAINLTHTYNIGPCLGTSCVPGYISDCYNRYEGSSTTGAFMMGINNLNQGACFPVGSDSNVCAGSKLFDMLDMFEWAYLNQPTHISSPFARIEQILNQILGSWNILYPTQTYVCPAPALGSTEVIDDFKALWKREAVTKGSCC